MMRSSQKPSKRGRFSRRTARANPARKMTDPAADVVGGTVYTPVSNQITQIQRGPFPFADSYRVRLRYCDRVQLTTAGSVNTATGYTFRLSSLYDPDYTGAGHQPYMFDQLTPIYNKYIVEKVEYKVRFRQVASSPITSLWCGYSLLTDTNAAASAVGDTINEIRERSTALVSPLAAVNNAANFKTWQGAVVNRVLFGLTEAQYYGDQEDFGAAYNANPSRQCFLELFLVDPDSGSSTTVEADVEMVYHAKMYGYVAPSQS